MSKKECKKSCYKCEYLIFWDYYICSHKDSDGEFIKNAEENSCDNFKDRGEPFWL